MTAMNAMFQNAVKFNQPIELWDVSKAELMSEMFNGARAFNQSLAGWRLDSLVSTTGLPNSYWSGAPRMLNNSGLSTKNYDATLISWNARSTNSPLILGAAGLKYCAADTSRANLIKATANGGHGWTINGGSKECPKHTVVFDVQGGTAIANQEVAYTGKIIEPAVPTRQGYTFVGWYADAVFTRAWNFTVDTMPDNGLTLYAKWTENPKPAAISSGTSENNSSSSTKLAETGVDAGIFFSAAVAFIAVGSIAIKLIKRR
jgi:internalin A (fragment)